MRRAFEKYTLSAVEKINPSRSMGEYRMLVGMLARVCLDLQKFYTLKEVEQRDLLNYISSPSKEEFSLLWLYDAIYDKRVVLRTKALVRSFLELKH